MALAAVKRLAGGVLAAVMAAGVVQLVPPEGTVRAEDPCALAVSLLCRFMPIAPDLEGDVDYTQQLPAGANTVLAPESGAPADPCVSECI
ncbi:fibronectin-binding protein [Mycolicibacterium sp. P9-22]|uniref:fibronectin-binding protein n=1 Tax=Mycolicibacterium sp. P9-22 TaxID=2024613 RepID=UPI0011F044D6|nr:fibronectin-binding protein [Mycolicibacterium sp. P9-22]KAA0120598.1 fibronectin-binding protein [Mycolicibacterium sp. P9-22]